MEAPQRDWLVMTVVHKNTEILLKIEKRPDKTRINQKEG